MSVSLQTAQSADDDSLSRFLAEQSRNKDASFWSQRLEFWWDQNPAFQSHHERGWILRDGERIVGFFGMVPMLFQTPAGIVTAQNATSWYVDAAYRQFSMQLFFRSMSYASEAILFDTTPSADVIRILRAFQFQLLPRGTREPGQRRVSLYVARGSAVLRKALGGRLPGFALSLPGAVITGLQTLRVRQPAPKYRVEEKTRVDTEFDTLWDETRHRFAYTSVRTAEVLNWFCFAFSVKPKRLLAAYDAQDQLAAYAVFHDPQLEGIRALEGIDFWWRDGQAASLMAIIATAARTARRDGFDLLILPHHTAELEETYAHLRLFTRRLGPRVDFGRVPQTQRSVSAENSYFTGMQGDYAL